MKKKHGKLQEFDRFFKIWEGFLKTSKISNRLMLKKIKVFEISNNRKILSIK